MSKLKFSWEKEELIIKQCDKMKTSPQSCTVCEHRFKCYTERIKPNDKKVSSKTTHYLSDIMKEIDKIGTD